MQIKDHDKSVKTYFDQTDNYLLKNPSILTRAILIKKYFSSLRDKNILDLGCGDGSLSIQFLSENRVTLVDISKEMLSHVKQSVEKRNTKNALIVHSTIQDFHSNIKYDVVFCVGVLAHVSSIEDTLLSIQKLLKENGVLVLQYTDWDNFYTRLSRLWVGMFNKQKRTGFVHRLNQTRRQGLMRRLSEYSFEVKEENKYLSSVFGLGRISVLFAARMNIVFGKTPLLNLLCGEKLVFLVKHA